MKKAIPVLALAASLLSAAAGFLHVVDPRYAIIATALAGAISAFTEKVTNLSPSNN